MKRALVTGGSGEIGAAICKALAADGLEVIVHSHRRPERAEAIVGQIRAAGGSGRAVQFDVSDTETSRKAVEIILADGPVQVLVHNAGIHADAPLAGMRAEQWHEVIAVSLHGFFNVAQPLLLPMMGTRWGRIIAMSSVAGVMGHRGQANYAAAKAGLHGACKSLAIEVASRGVTVNVIAPGVIQTAMAEQAFSPEVIQSLIPMKRAGTPEEVAQLVGFLASEQAAYISGQIIGINGALV